jgi:hypothetical protein
MENKDVTAELTAYMRNVSWDMSEMVRVLRELVGSVYLLNESVDRIDSSLAEIRKFLILGP